MTIEKMQRQFDILGVALNAASVRNEVIVSNISNNDLPGYKTKTVDFESSLSQALDRLEETGELDLSEAKPSVRVVNENYNYRIDENNVDIEMEMVSLYQNSVKYDALINIMNKNSQRMSLVLTGR